MRQVLAVVGTRSEMVRLAPVIRRLRDEGGRSVGVRWIHAGSHAGQVWQTGAAFGLSPDGEVLPNHSPANLLEHSWALTNAISKEMESRPPELLIVQGESLPAMLAAQQAFMRRILVIYLTAPSYNGIRELKGPQNSYRKLLNAISAFQCVANEQDLMQLRERGVPAFEIGITGDTVVDAIDTVMRHGALNGGKPNGVPTDGRATTRILVPLGPASRWVGSLTDFALAIADLAQSASALEFTIVVEPDAACRDLLTAILDSSPNVVLREAMPYPEFLRLMEQQDIVLADSLDYYDEAVALGKPTLLAQAPISDQDLPPLTGLTFIGEKREQIVRGVLASRATNGSTEHRYPLASPLGDGHAAARIARLVMNWSRNQILTPRAFEPFRS
ncbi:MAG: UDP-N-acetylglucosamine 2-epimerase [Betaproteobacteria bacterium]|jgi:UDP-N-acetylglucosamine 2-epimerase (non-hydrolysing)